MKWTLGILAVVLLFFFIIPQFNPVVPVFDSYCKGKSYYSCPLGCKQYPGLCLSSDPNELTPDCGGGYREATCVPFYKSIH